MITNNFKLLVCIFVIFVVSCVNKGPMKDISGKIPLKDYFTLFEPPTFFDIKQPNTTKDKIDSAIVELCKADYQSEYSIELLLYKVITNTDEGKVYYIFDVRYHDDKVIAYLYDDKVKKIIYKFYIPMG